MMNSVNRLGLITVAITAAVSLGLIQGYFSIDHHLNISQKYASLFRSLDEQTKKEVSHTAVAGIKDIASTSSPTILPNPGSSKAINYTDLYKEDMGVGAGKESEDPFSKEKLNNFIVQHTELYQIDNLHTSLPLSISPETDILTVYTELPFIHGSDILALLEVPQPNIPPTAQSMIEKIRSILITLEKTGTTPRLSSSAENYAGSLSKTLQGLTLLARINDDLVGGMIGASQVSKMAPILDQSTTAFQNTLTNQPSGSDCGFCLSPEDLLNNATNGLSEGSTPLPSPSTEPSVLVP